MPEAVAVAGVPVETPAWSQEEYHADGRFMNHSKLKLFMADRPLFEGRYITGELPEPEPTEAVRLGDVVHRALLSPEIVASTVSLIPEHVLTSNGQRRGKAWDEWKAEQGDRLCVKENVPGQILAMREELLSNPATRGWFDGSEETATEVTACWTDPATGLPLKARLDLLQAGIAHVADVKVTAFARADFPRQVPKIWWHTQMALYRRAARLLTGAEPVWKWVAIRSEEPFDAYSWVPNDGMLWDAEEILRRGLADLRRAIDENAWRDPCWGKDNECYLPSWASPWDGPLFD